MNQFDTEALRVSLNAEKAELRALQRAYTEALRDVKIKILKLKQRKATPGTAQSIEYQLNYAYQQEAELTDILTRLNKNVVASAQEYLQASYDHGFFGTAYTLHGHGVPVAIGVDQRAMAEAVQMRTSGLKFSERLYKENLEALKTRYLSTLARGLGGGMSFSQIASQLSLDTGISLRRAYTIARTEGARVYETARQHGMEAAKAKGADIVKQWSSVLDHATRLQHQNLDGQIREIEEPYEIDGMTAMHPLGFGIPGMDICCRCKSITRARWMVEAEQAGEAGTRTKWDGERGQLVPYQPYEKWRKEYDRENGGMSMSELRKLPNQHIPQNPLQNEPNNGIIKTKDRWEDEPANGSLSNQDTRKWYLEHVAGIDGQINHNAPIEVQAQQAFELRNRYRSKARDLMADQTTRKGLDEERPNLTFEALVKSKMVRKGMTRDEAVRDIIRTATSTNDAVNRELGLEG